MGTDIIVSSPDGYEPGAAHFHFSLNRARALIKYGFRFRDYHEKTVKETYIALNNAIMAMITAGIKPLIGIELWAYNEDDPGALGNAIDFRNGLEAKTGMDWLLWIDQ
jgi:hypothetical protein